MSQTPSPRRRPARSLRVPLCALPVIAMGTLTACGGLASSAPEGEPVKVALGAASGTRTVQAGDRITVTAQGGVLTEVTVTDPGGHKLPGGLGGDKTVWTARTKTAPGTKYSVVARTRNPQGDVAATKESLTTAKPARVGMQASGPGRPDGVAGTDLPLAVTFGFPVTHREEVQRRLNILTDRRTTGSWTWTKDHGGQDRADWSPARRGQSGAAVALWAELDADDSGGGVTQDYDLNFTIGRSCTDSAAGRECGKVQVGDPLEVAASSVRGKDDRTTRIGDWHAG
ncbi:Ig-like domain-containing protein [Streptomyces sp. NBC_01456]|uniref:Ig-like domain-containing protein n=1 Tax=unclassified Streptomyces TaxID=2593676 RepID=UPI002E31742F|nr:MULTISPECIES: Ig-like domain-containing protein [unclassified Streptomyces]